MSKDMCPRNRPNFNTESRLTPNGGGVVGVRPGSAPAGTAAGYRRASRPALREFFASGTAVSVASAPGGSGGLPADVDALATTLGRPGRAAGDVVTPAASAEPVAGLGPEASRKSGTGAAVTGPDADLAVVPPAGPGAHVSRRVEVLPAADRSRALTPSPGGLAAAG